MDVEQAMKWSERTAAQVIDPKALEVARTLAAEVRRLRGDLSPVILDRIRDMGWSKIVDEATVNVHAWHAARATRAAAEAARRKA